MATLVDTSVWVSIALGTEALSSKAQEALEEAVEPTLDTTVALETFLVLRSKKGVAFASEAVARMLESYAYAPVARTTIRRAVLGAGGVGLPLGDAVIVANAAKHRARLLTLDERQAQAAGDAAILVGG